MTDELRRASGSPAAREWCVCARVCVCEFAPFHFQTSSVGRENEEQWEMRQGQNGGPGGEREVVWTADKFEKKTQCQSGPQESWNRAIGWGGGIERKVCMCGSMEDGGSCACSCLIPVCSSVWQSYLGCVPAEAERVHLVSFRLWKGNPRRYRQSFASRKLLFCTPWYIFAEFLLPLWGWTVCSEHQDCVTFLSSDGCSWATEGLL